MVPGVQPSELQPYTEPMGSTGSKVPAGVWAQLVPRRSFVISSSLSLGLESSEDSNEGLMV